MNAPGDAVNPPEDAREVLREALESGQLHRIIEDTVDDLTKMLRVAEEAVMRVRMRALPVGSAAHERLAEIEYMLTQVEYITRQRMLYAIESGHEHPERGIVRLYTEEWEAGT